MMRRRTFLRTGTAAAAALTLSGTLGATPPKPSRISSRDAVFFIPGYAPDSGFFEGRSITQHPTFTSKLPRGYDGPLTLITRLDGTSRAVGQVLMPLQGHEITVSPDGRHAMFNSMNGPSMLTFDPGSLEIGGIAPVHEAGFICGGHAAYTADGKTLLVVERRDWAPFTGKPQDHFGRIVARDPATLKVLGHFSSGGIAPHEVNLLADGKHVAVAHYGRTYWPESKVGDLPQIVEPSLTVIEIATGKIVYKVVSDDRRFEVRHLAAHSLERLFAVQGRLASFTDTQDSMSTWPTVYEPDAWSAGIEGYGYLPSPVLRYDLTSGEAQTRAIIAPDPNLMRYAQSLIYDPVHDEAIGTFPSRHCVIVFDGVDGHIKKVIRTDRLGLRQPRGITLHPDGVHYAVSGYWMDIYMFDRGSHEIDREACLYQTFFGHSHSTVTGHI